MMTRVLFLVFVVLLTPVPAKAAAERQRENCKVQTQLLVLLSEAENFLKNLDTGKDPQAADKMRKRLDETPVADLMRSVKAAGIESAGGATLTLMNHLHTVSGTYQHVGREKARRVAANLGTRAALSEYKSVIVPLPCGDDAGDFRTNQTGLGTSPKIAIPQLSVLVTLSLLALGMLLHFAEKRQTAIDRRAHRIPCLIPCTVQSPKGRHPAEIVDISQLGAQIKTLSEYKPGSRIIIYFGNHFLTGTVRWHNSNYSGVEFEDRLSVANLSAILHGSSAEDHPTGTSSQDAMPENVVHNRLRV
ncbi:MAG: hypothetical protein GJ676_15600 [Rhodobacteraceae bacterium]|nr:hypothetical protein [Paracoccaceae bacterium]